MTRWKKGETEFTVSVSYNEHRGYQCYIPKPIIEKLGKPNSIKFFIKGEEIILESATSA